MILRNACPLLTSQLTLRLSFNEMNDAMGSKDSVSLLLAFGVLPPFPVLHKPLPAQKKKMQEMALARAEMATFTTELRIKQALKSELPSATHYRLQPGNLV